MQIRRRPRSPSRHDSGAHGGNDLDASQAASLSFWPPRTLLAVSASVREPPESSVTKDLRGLCVNLQFAATLFLVHFEGAAALFDFFLKAYFAPAEACTAIVRTAKKAATRRGK